MLSFSIPGPEHAAILLAWRTQPEITRFMFTDVAHGVAEQEAWLRASLGHTDYRHWLIEHDGKPIGLISLQGIDWAHRRAASGFYIGEPDFKRLAGFALASLYNHAFHDLVFEAMTAQVFEENRDVLRMHLAHGYRDTGMVERTKNGELRRVHELVLTREAWLAQKSWKRYRSEFPWPEAASSSSK